ncbi:hypothetical protein C8R46DRAFT_1035979 [Mycena filopes]|nr:hypothetical protein C8R46DRAFT_1035979 [Mycena filopes]
MLQPPSTTTDPSRWVLSRGGAFYWRHATQSYWKGPPDDRVWVPSMDMPPDMPPPPDFGDRAPGPVAAAAPRNNAPVTQFGSIIPYQNVQHGPPAYQQSMPPADLGFAHPNPFVNPQRCSRVDNVTQSPGSNYISPFAGHSRRDFTSESGRGNHPADAPPASVPPPPTARSSVPPPRAPTAPSRTSSTPHRDDRGAPPHLDYRPLGRRDVRDDFGRSLSSESRREAQRSQTQEYQERARDQQLRNRALSSRPSTSPAHTASPPSSNRPLPPRVDDAPRDSRGHPMLPIVAGGMEDDESDYGDEEKEDPEDEKVIKEYRVKERARHAEATRRHLAGEQPKITAQRPPGAIIGVWGDVAFNTVSEARNLVQWMTAGCPRARAMYTYLVQFYGQNFIERRSDGIGYLMRVQNDAEKAWLFATTGDTTPRSRRDSNRDPQSRTRNARRKKKKLGRVPTVGPSPRTAPEDDVPMPPAQDTVSRDEQSYLGTSPPALGAGSTDPSSSAASLSMALEELTWRAPRSWQGGARTINGDWPDAITPLGTRMLPNDARVSRYLGFIAPARRDGTSVHRIRFISEVLVAFSVMGLFERFAQRGEWEGAALPLEHYPFDCQNLTMSQALSWVHQHGIAPGSADAVILHSFAKSWRNRQDRNNSPNGEEFAERPRNNVDVLNWLDAESTSWRHLVHGPPITDGGRASPASSIPEDTEMSPPEDGEVIDNVVSPVINPADVPLPSDDSDENWEEPAGKDGVTPANQAEVPEKETEGAAA